MPPDCHSTPATGHEHAAPVPVQVHILVRRPAVRADCARCPETAVRDRDRRRDDPGDAARSAGALGAGDFETGAGADGERAIARMDLSVLALRGQRRIIRSGYTAADAALDRLRAARSDEETRIAVADLQRIMYEDPPAAFLVRPETARAVNDSFVVPADAKGSGAT